MSLAIYGHRKNRPTLWLASVLHGGGDDRPCSCLVVRNCQPEFHDTPAEPGKWKCKHNFRVKPDKSRQCWVPPCKEWTRSTPWAVPPRPATLVTSLADSKTDQSGQNNRNKEETIYPEASTIGHDLSLSFFLSWYDGQLLFTKQERLGLLCWKLSCEGS